MTEQWFCSFRGEHKVFIGPTEGSIILPIEAPIDFNTLYEDAVRICKRTLAVKESIVITNLYKIGESE